MPLSPQDSLGTLDRLPREIRRMVFRSWAEAAFKVVGSSYHSWFTALPNRTALLRVSTSVYAEAFEAFMERDIADNRLYLESCRDWPHRQCLVMNTRWLRGFLATTFRGGRGPKIKFLTTKTLESRHLSYMRSLTITVRPDGVDYLPTFARSHRPESPHWDAICSKLTDLKTLCVRFNGSFPYLSKVDGELPCSVVQDMLAPLLKSCNLLRIQVEKISCKEWPQLLEAVQMTLSSSGFAWKEEEREEEQWEEFLSLAISKKAVT